MIYLQLLFQVFIYFLTLKSDDVMVDKSKHSRSDKLTLLTRRFVFAFWVLFFVIATLLSLGGIIIMILNIQRGLSSSDLGLLILLVLVFIGSAFHYGYHVKKYSKFIKQK